MKVSVVVPAHNEENVIPGVIKALLAQDHPDFEVIIVDNASTDKTSEVARSFSEKSDKVRVVHESKKGLLHARERGRKEATGEIIVNIDADCAPDEDWLRKGIIHFTNPHIIAVTGPYKYEDGPAFFGPISSFYQKAFYKPTNSLLQYFKKGAILTGGNNFVRASALDSINGYTTSILFWGEDTDTARRLSSVGKVHYANDLEMVTSARRFNEQGTLGTLYRYMANFFWVTFFKKPYAKE